MARRGREPVIQNYLGRKLFVGNSGAENRCLGDLRVIDLQGSEKI